MFKVNFCPVVERLERRDTPAYTAALVGNTSTFTGDGASDTLIVFADPGAITLRHNRGGDPGFASPYDFDSAVLGEQVLTAAVLTTVVVDTMGGGDDTVQIGTPARPANTLLTRFRVLAGGAGTDRVSVDNSGDTNPATYTHTATGLTGPTLSVEVQAVLEFGEAYSFGAAGTTFNLLAANNTVIVGFTGTGNSLTAGSPTAGMTGVQGDIQVNGAFGATAAITLDDAASTTADSISVTPVPVPSPTGGQVTGMHPGTVSFAYAVTSSLTIRAGGGADTIFYRTDTDVTSPAIFGGGGDDQFVLNAAGGVNNTESLILNGEAGADRFDVIGAFPAGLGLTVRGGTGAGADRLTLGAPAGATATLAYGSAAGSGSVQPSLAVFGVGFAELEGVSLTGTPASVLLNLPADARPGLVLGDDGGAADPFGAAAANTSLFSGPSIYATRFTNPTTALVVNLGAGGGAVTMNAMDAAYAPQTSPLVPGGTFLRGGTGADSFTVTPDADSLVTVTGNAPTAPPGDTLTIATRVTNPKDVRPDGTIVTDLGTVAYTGIEALNYTFDDIGFAVGTGVGPAPRARTFNPDGSERGAVSPFDAAATGGVRVAGADFTRDGVPDLVVGTGPGVVARVRVLDGVTGAELFALNPFDDFTGGVFVAAGDLTGDGRADLVITPDESGGPRVRVFDGNGFGQLADFFGIDDPAFRGGARAALGDVTGDGFADLLVSAGFGGGPRVAGFDGKALAGGTRTKLFADFFVFEEGLRNGAFLAVGDFNGDGIADLAAGAGPGGGPRVLILDGAAVGAGNPVGAAVLANFFAGDEANRGGVRVAARHLDADARTDLVVGSGAGAGNRVTAYLGAALTAGATTPALSFDAFPGEAGGVFVG